MSGEIVIPRWQVMKCRCDCRQWWAWVSDVRWKRFPSWAEACAYAHEQARLAASEVP